MLEPKEGLIFWTLIVFVILLYLLRRYAWSPILTKIKQREEYIEGSFEEARRIREENEKLLLENKEIVNKAKKQSVEIIDNANRTSKSILNQAKEESEKRSKAIIEEAKAIIDRDRIDMIKNAKKEIVDLSITIAEKVINRELEDKSKQKDIVKNFVNNI